MCLTHLIARPRYDSRDSFLSRILQRRARGAEGILGHSLSDYTESDTKKRTLGSKRARRIHTHCPPN
jgi:hypothetical protein